MRNTLILFKRELGGYFATPVAYVFIVIFLFLTGIFTFNLGGFYERELADLQPFFGAHPWLYLFLIPAISMRLWAEERKTGTIELLMTLPVSMGQVVLGKYLAAWCFTRSNPVLAERLYSHPRFGPLLTAWRDQRAIPRHAKIYALTALALSYGLILYLAESRTLPAILAVIMGSVALYIATRPKPRDAADGTLSD